MIRRYPRVCRYSQGVLMLRVIVTLITLLALTAISDVIVTIVNPNPNPIGLLWCLS